MRIVALVAAVTLLGCADATEPVSKAVVDGVLTGTGAALGKRHVLGTLIASAGYGPTVEAVVEGTKVTVHVTTYGNSCVTAAATEVEVTGMEATIVPWDHDPGCHDRLLKQVSHTVEIDFGQSGTARILVRGIDQSPVAGPDTVTIERVVLVP